MGTEESSPDSELRTYYKQQAAEQGTEFVQSGMAVGLGTGSTAIFATRRIAQLLRNGQLKDIVGFATSKAVWEEARRLGIPMMAEEMPRAIDLTIDGADEISICDSVGGLLDLPQMHRQAARGRGRDEYQLGTMQT